MKVINDNKIKESLTKGFVLVTLAGALVTKNPVASNNRNTVVYAAESLDTKISKALKNLEKVYKYYSKSYYSTKEYSKLTKYYNKGVKAINACKDKTSINDTYNEYKELLNSVKPSILVKYQKKMEKSLLKSYKSLVTKNEYFDYNLSKLESIKDEGIEKIYGAKTKSKSKKAKTSYVKQLKSVTTLLDQTRSYVVNYINSNSNLSNNEKQAIIEEINNTSNVDAIVAIGEEYGYEEVVDETITVEQINAKIKELCKKYPKYTEDEIRVLVATANMDFVKEEDLLTIFDVSSKTELGSKAELLDTLIGERVEGYSYENFENCGWEEHVYDETGRTQKEMVQFKDLCLNSKVQKSMKYIYNLSKPMINRDVTRQDQESVTKGNLAVAELIVYILDLYDEVSYFEKNEKIYSFSDEVFNNTGIGYIYKNYVLGLENFFVNRTVLNSMPSSHNYADELDAAYPEVNPITNLKKKVK